MSVLFLQQLPVVREELMRTAGRVVPVVELLQRTRMVELPRNQGKEG